MRSHIAAQPRSRPWCWPWSAHLIAPHGVASIGARRPTAHLSPEEARSHRNAHLPRHELDSESKRALDSVGDASLRGQRAERGGGQAHSC